MSGQPTSDGKFSEAAPSKQTTSVEVPGRDHVYEQLAYSEEQPSKTKRLKGHIGNGETNAGLDKLIIEISNVTSAIANKKTIMQRAMNTTMQLLQEVCMTKGKRASWNNELRAIGKIFIGGPTDPEQKMPAAGVGCIAGLDRGVHAIPRPTKS